MERSFLHRLVCRALLASMGTLGPVEIASALDTAKLLSQYRVDVWHVRDGLPQESVRAIAETSDGYLWLGTQAGLVRFDGDHFRVFSSRNTPEFQQRDHILALRADRDGGLWIGTAGGGLLHAKNGRFRAFSSADGLPVEQIRSILTSRDGTLWIGTETGGLQRYDGRQFVRVPLGTGEAESTVRCLLENSDGSIWAGTDGGLKAISHGVVRTFTRKDGLLSDAVWALAQSQNGDLWIGTRLGGLSRMSGGVIQSYGRERGLPDPTVLTILADKNGSLWLGTDGGGLVRFRDNRFETLPAASGFLNDIVRCVFEDREGSLWVGTAGGGLARLSDQPFTVFSKREGMTSNLIWSVAVRRSGGVWVGQGTASAGSTESGGPPRGHPPNWTESWHGRSMRTAAATCGSAPAPIACIVSRMAICAHHIAGRGISRGDAVPSRRRATAQSGLAVTKAFTPSGMTQSCRSPRRMVWLRTG